MSKLAPTFGSLTLAFMGVFIVLHGILLYADQGTISEYSFSAGSSLVKASTLPKLYEADEKSGNDDNCIVNFPTATLGVGTHGYGISHHVNASEKLYIKTTTSGIFVYLCDPDEDSKSSKKSSSSDDDDEDDDTGNTISENNFHHCIEQRFDASSFKTHHLGLAQRLIACPIDNNGLMDCPLQTGCTGGNNSAVCSFDKCEAARFGTKCTRLINFYTGGWPVLGLVASSLYFVGGLLFVGGQTSGAPVRMAGAIIVLGTHILVLIGTIYRVTAAHALHDADGECIGSFIENELGGTLDEQDSMFDDGIVFTQLIVTLFGAIFFAVTFKLTSGNILKGDPTFAGVF